jgi:cell division septum initiation protein DivIVA
MTSPQGGDDGRPAPSFLDRRPLGARHRGAPGAETPVRRPDRTRFVTVVRGYDRIEVDEYVAEVDRLLEQLRSELADSDERRRLAEQRVEVLEGENRAVRARLEAAPAPLEEGFGVRAERLLRLAEQEAAEVRSEAAEEAATMRQRAREDVERQRHEAEQALIARSAQFDERAAQRTAELQRREQQIAEQLDAARREAESVQAAARRAADQYRERVEAGAEETKARAAAEVTQIREQAAQELERLSTLENGVRAELLRLSARLTQEIAREAPNARAGVEAARHRDTEGRAAPDPPAAGRATPAPAGAGAEAHR